MSTASPRIEPAGAADAGFSATEIERYSREREAHNKYFSEGTRKALDKYYATTRQTQAAYERVLVSRCRNGAALEYGSAASRRPSPKKLNASTMMKTGTTDSINQG